MEKHLCSENQENVEAKVERDLLQAIIHAEGIGTRWKPGEPLTTESIQVAELPGARVSYPWNPMVPDAEQFFTELETDDIFEGIPDEEVGTRAGRFFTHMDALWAATSMQSTLSQRFAARVPSALIAAIAQHAHTVVAETQKAMAASLSIADQLVQCVRELAPNLGDDDLYVLARPLAYQMRNEGGLQDAINSAVAQVPQVEWQQLSDVQQARLSLAIARCAIDQLQPHLQD